LAVSNVVIVFENLFKSGSRIIYHKPNSIRECIRIILFQKGNVFIIICCDRMLHFYVCRMAHINPTHNSSLGFDKNSEVEEQIVAE
jgi:hypothetical protein